MRGHLITTLAERAFGRSQTLKSQRLLQPATNVIERCFVEARRRTRPMVCFVNVASVDRIIYAIFNGLNENHEWKNRTLRLVRHAA